MKENKNKGIKKVDPNKKERKIDINGYIIIRVNGYIIPEHRYIWEINKGKIPKDFFIHHINQNRQDNDINNLECVSRKEHGLRHQKPNRKRIISPNGNIKVIKEK